MKRSEGPREKGNEVASPRPPRRRADRMALAAAVAAIVAAVALWFPLLEAVSLVFSVFALVFGVMSLLRLAREPAGGGRWIATAGVLLGASALVVGISRVDKTITEFEPEQLERRP